MKEEIVQCLSTDVHCKTLFKLFYPVDYADHFERKRNKSWFIKMQKLEKKSQKIRQEMESLLIKCTQQASLTRQLAITTLDFTNRVVEKRAKKGFVDLEEENLEGI
ncbi:hypothetical protein [Segetibacter koreensis]|uniref:hypothetical protein n=1 Tax=Segetibacter koreensis TaxID=398037 RepID=UPI0003737DD5|nr:hypothetical protein [Segetibacter koreensis]